MESGKRRRLTKIRNQRGFSFKAPLGFNFSRYFLGSIINGERVYKDQRDCLMLGEIRPSTLVEVLSEFYNIPPSQENSLKIILINPLISKACQEVLLKDLESGRDKIVYIFLVSNKSPNQYLPPIKSRLGDTIICEDLNPRESLIEEYKPFISDFHDLKMVERNDQVIQDALLTLDASILLNTLINNKESYTAWVGIITHHTKKLLDNIATNHHLYKISNMAIMVGNCTKKYDPMAATTFISLIFGLIKMTRPEG